MRRSNLPKDLDNIDSHYRARFEQDGNTMWLLEYSQYPSAWRRFWFKEAVRQHLVFFIGWSRAKQLPFARIAAWLNANGPRPHRGMCWYRSSVRHLADFPSTRRENVKIRATISFLKGLRYSRENPQQWRERITAESNSPQDRARRVWELRATLLPLLRAFARHFGQCHKKFERASHRYSGTGMYRKGEFGRDFFGTPSFPCKGLVELFVKGNEKRKRKVVAMLGGTLLGFEDLYPTKRDVELLGKHKLKEAALRIACRLEGISVKTAGRYKPQVVQ